MYVKALTAVSHTSLLKYMYVFTNIQEQLTVYIHVYYFCFPFSEMIYILIVFWQPDKPGTVSGLFSFTTFEIFSTTQLTFLSPPSLLKKNTSTDFLVLTKAREMES